MGARRKPQLSEVELVKSLCNGDEITRLTQINTAFAYKNTELIQENIRLDGTLVELKKIIEGHEKSKDKFQKEIEALTVLSKIEAQQRSILSEGYTQRVKELNTITSNWRYKLFF